MTREHQGHMTKSNIWGAILGCARHERALSFKPKFAHHLRKQVDKGQKRITEPVTETGELSS